MMTLMKEGKPTTFPSKSLSTIWLIDDDLDEFYLVQAALGKVDPAIELRFTLGCIDVKDLQQHVDLILLDINMPTKDGFACLKMMFDNGYSHIPIVMYSNSAAPTQISKAYDEGASLYFIKPDGFVELINGLEK